ncbi:MAG: S1 RNA-binding domain-containing protein, partial [Pseudomonadota bacterium]
MATRMLIDARHTEETRVAVLKGNRIEEFDFESAEHKQIKGNIYLAKVTRVEPSLQAAFVDFGGNRHGFLAFSEIHPDYYQIPQDDRERLLAEEAEAARRAEEDAQRAAEAKAAEEARLKADAEAAAEAARQQAAAAEEEARRNAAAAQAAQERAEAEARAAEEARLKAEKDAAAEAERAAAE